MLVNFLNKDSVLILCLNKLLLKIKNFFYSPSCTNKNTLFIDCNTPKDIRLISWTMEHAENLKIILNKSSCNLLCKYYENDLSGLNQILNQLSLTYPKTHLNIKDIKILIAEMSSQFSLSDLLNATLNNDKELFNHIIEKLKTKNTPAPITILHTIQHTISLLIILKRYSPNKNSYFLLFNKYKIPKNRHSLFIKALQNLTLETLYQIITLLSQMELTIHQEDSNNIWKNFKLLSWLLFNNKI